EKCIAGCKTHTAANHRHRSPKPTPCIYHYARAPSRAPFAISIAFVCMILLPRSAFAHPAPAEAPDFGMPACITVVDKTEHGSVDIAYTLAMDDTAFGPLDIPMPD